ncbi:MAG TPA: response regulator [Verrucomicrobiae bacterium]|nr:response regulator [Verrucomicrobiae bacterium]
MSKVLIIEDDQIVANIYRNKLSIEGFNVEIAHDGAAGLECIHQFRPDAVVLDLMLPKMTGVDLMKKVRTETEFQKLPIIVFSNTYLTNMVQEAWKAGATKCLSKANCSPKQLLEVVRSTLTANGTPVPHPLQARPPGAIEPEEEDQAAAEENAGGSAPQDVAFQAALRKDFVESLPASIAQLRGLLQSLIKAPDDETRLKAIQEMYKRIHAFTSNAGMTGMYSLAQLSDALEALLKELQDKPKNLNASTLRTVATAVDFVGTLSARADRAEPLQNQIPRILVVDDEAISRRAVTYALERGKLKAMAVEDSQSAYNLLLESKFDLIFLDVDMPGMNGFELCSKLRMLPAHKTTPVIFVTSLTDLESRANSTMSGGNDFIAKPFLFLELTVKALVFLLRSRLARPR